MQKRKREVFNIVKAWELTLDDINKLYLSREQLLDWWESPFLKEALPGAFVKV